MALFTNNLGDCFTHESDSDVASSGGICETGPLDSSATTKDRNNDSCAASIPSPEPLPMQNTSRFPTHTTLLWQTTLSFKPLAPEEWRAKEKQHYYDRQAEREDAAEQLKVSKAQKAIEKRKWECMRKREQCACKRRAAEAADLGKIPSQKRPVSVSTSLQCELLLKVMSTSSN